MTSLLDTAACDDDMPLHTPRQTDKHPMKTLSPPSFTTCVVDAELSRRVAGVPRVVTVAAG